MADSAEMLLKNIMQDKQEIITNKAYCSDLWDEIYNPQIKVLMTFMIWLVSVQAIRSLHTVAVIVDFNCTQHGTNSCSCQLSC